MQRFTSTRERRLWFAALAVVVAIYSTLGLAGTFAALLRERDLVESFWITGLIILVGVTLGIGLTKRPGWR